MRVTSFRIAVVSLLPSKRKKAATASIVALVLLLSAAGNVHAQTPGLIIKPHTATISPLDPNGDGFTAASITGFQLNDLAESELLFKDIPYVALEPTGDLRRGPAGLYSDIVRDPSTGSGVGVYNDGTNLIFRMRLGGTVSGSKCYAILIDTDSKFGASGPNADPNCLPQTTGVNGNPGFEIEIDLQTNFRVAVYNVDGISNPSVPTAAYATPLNTQISLALTATSGNPDFFYDWYVPLSDLTALGVTNSTPLRFAATTGMAPLPVVGGPKSDIFGIDDSEYSSTNDGWNALVPNIPPVTFTNLTSGGSGFAAVCTNAPLIDNPISVGSNIAITGTWTRLNSTHPQTTTITLYRNGAPCGTTSATSGGAWSIVVATVAAGETFYAKAQSNAQSQCEQSTVVTATTCNTSNTTSTSGLAITCLTMKGIQGTRPAGASIKIYRITASGMSLYATDGSTLASPTGFNVYYGSGASAGSWYYDGGNLTGGNPCSGSSNSMSSGSYAATATASGSCESGYIIGNFCIGSPSPTTTALPVISNTPLYAGLSSLNGAAATGVSVMLFVNDGLVATTTAAGGTYSFTGLSNIKANDVVSVRAIASGNSCVSAAATATVQCHLTVPLINANTSNQITAGTFITGVSSAGAGATINIYNSSNALLGSATVSASGTFTTGISALAGTSYYAQAVTTCGTSSSSATVSALAGVSSARCGSITAATITTTSTAVNGTLSSSVANTTVTLYLDSVAIGSVLTSGTTWSIAVNTTYTNKLYSGGKITMGVTEAGKQEVMCASAATVPCPTNAMPAVSPSNVMMSIAESVTYALSTTAAGVLYTLEDATSFSDWAVSRLGTGSGMTIGTYAFPNTGTYSLRMKGTSFDGMGCDATANVSVSVINKPPVANNLFAPRMNSCADTTVLPSLTAGDPDGTIASYKITSLPTGAAGVLYLCNPSCNAVALNDMIPAGDASKLKFDPSPSFTGSVSFTYAATDNLGLEGNNAMYAIGVYNNPPAANNVLSQKLAYINAPIQLPPFSGFDADGTVVSYTVLNIPSGQQGTLYFCNPNCTAVPVGKVVQAVNGGKFMFAPAADFAGYAEFNYAATDNNGSISEPAVYIIPVGLTEENLPPVSERIESHSIHNNAGQTTIPPLYGLDIDGVVSSYSILSLPAPEHGTLYLCNPSCIVVTDNQTIYAGEEEFLKFSPNLSFMGTAYFTYAARDDDGTLGNTARYEIPVLNNAPVANPVTTQFVSNAALQNSIPSLTGYDRDGSVSHFNITSLPSAAAGTLYFCNPSCGVAIAGQTIIPADAAKLRFEPVPGFTGEAMFTYTATDNNGNVSSDSRYTIPVNTFSYGNGIPPVTNNVTNAPIANMASATAITALSATDADGAVTGYVIHSVPSPYQGSLQLCNPACAGVAVGQTVSAANAANLRFLPTPGYRGNTIFRYAARDDKGNLGNLATYSIPVSADLPTAFNAVSVVLNVNDGAMSIATLSGAGPSGTVSTYKITSVPDASHGLLYLCKPGCSAINVNQFIDVADANKLRFDPSAYAVGLFAMFNYAAVDDDGEQGNTATYNIPFTGGATVLPVQLVAFDAILNDDQTVDLSWVTASEMNSSFFDVERSYDVVHWELIGSRQAAGVSTHPLTYRFTDERPFTGVSYYRLRSVDADGSHRYSQIESVDIKRANANGMFVYPTPTSGLLNVRVDLALPEEMELNVYSSMGHLVMRAVVGVSPGKSVATLDLSTLPNGSYTIRARGRGLNGAAYVIKTD